MISASDLLDSLVETITSDLGSASTNISFEEEKRHIEFLKEDIEPPKMSRGVTKRRITFSLKPLLDPARQDKFETSLVNSRLEQV